MSGGSKTGGPGVIVWVISTLAVVAIIGYVAVASGQFRIPPFGEMLQQAETEQPVAPAVARQEEPAEPLATEESGEANTAPLEAEPSRAASVELDGAAETEEAVATPASAELAGSARAWQPVSSLIRVACVSGSAYYVGRERRVCAGELLVPVGQECRLNQQTQVAECRPIRPRGS